MKIIIVKGELFAIGFLDAINNLYKNFIIN